MEKAKQLLDYLATNPDATIQFRASDMIMNVHLDALYLSEANARSHACGHFFHGLDNKRWQPDQIKWYILYLVHNLTIRHGFRRRSQTRRPLPQLQRGHDFLNGPQRIGLSATKNAGPLQ
jgi:hypothetical protein